MKYELGKSWTNSSKTYQFFEGYCRWCEEIRTSPISISDIRQLLEHVSILNLPSRSKFLINYKLLTEAKLLGSEELLQEYYELIDSIKEHDYWIEKTYDTNSTFKINSFLSQESIPGHSEIRKIQRRRAIHQSLSFDESKDFTKSTFGKISQLIRGSHAFGSMVSELKDGSSHLFDCISRIHYELLDNSDHWLFSFSNQRCRNNPRRFFGDALILEIKPILITRTSANNYDTSDKTASYFEGYPASIEKYATAHATDRVDRSSGTASNTLKLLELSYYDNGRGVSENFKNFHPSYDLNTPTLLDVFENQLSTRDFEGAGKGFSRIVESVIDSYGSMCMTSGNESVIASPYSEKRLEHSVNKEFLHGTILTVLLPAE